MKRIIYVLVMLLLSACSANQIKLHSQLTPSNSGECFELAESITIKASNANTSKLNTGTEWREIGSIKQGVVFRTKDQIVIVNSFNVHEGYIVVKDSHVVGYYLPVEKTFVETKPVLINLVKMEKNNEI
ncbi:MAG: hypothetical protein L3J24_01190 [Xanthomonadales bacterium]|nr:hypothetical protein [Xanthomonadales bacterium]